jgi:uronate dehydrogenase
MSDRPLLVLTGGLGRVGQLLRPRLREKYRLRIVDRATGVPASLVDDEELVMADVRAAGDALAGASALLHLAGNPLPGADWESLYVDNVAATRWLLGAAAQRRVPRVVLASSVHALGAYHQERRYPVDPAWAPRPCCPYGLSKVVVETLGRFHAENTNASVVCLRFGQTGWPLTHEQELGVWLSDGDAGRLVVSALTAPVKYGVYFGVSANTRREWNISTTVAELGYRPQDDSERYAGSLTGC